MTPHYVATKPMESDRITLNTLVYVPIWRTGSVIGWNYGHVVEIQGQQEKGYLVCLMSAEPDNGKKQLYYGYSLACGMCHDRNPATCFQCSPVNEINHAECNKDFAQHLMPTH